MLCQKGAEKAVKAEGEAAGLASSFQRPGLVTFKAKKDLGVDDASFPFVFARHQALSLGRVDEVAVADVVARLDAIGARRFHVVAAGRDDDEAARAEEKQVRDALVDASDGVLRRQEEPKAGELVATIILVDGQRWLSVHRHGPRRSPFPGGLTPAALPAQAPSRAWLKLEEAARVFELPLEEGQRALELGSAPGGATRALLDRGLVVIGVDPNEMDPGVRAHPRFTHVRTVSTNVDPRSIPPLDWVLLDVNVPPGTALRGALPFVQAHATTLRGLVFTLKMKSWSIAGEVDGWLRRIRAAAPRLTLTARQLSSNGQEICVVGTTQREVVVSEKAR